VSIRLIYRGKPRFMRIALLAFGATAGLIAAAALLLMVLPTPHTRAHYLIAGTTPTLAALLALMARTQRERKRPQGFAVRRAASEN
jgi:hypothetical protein